jgi:hypothetical protein
MAAIPNLLVARGQRNRTILDPLDQYDFLDLGPRRPCDAVTSPRATFSDEAAPANTRVPNDHYEELTLPKGMLLILLVTAHDSTRYTYAQ